MGTKVVQKAFLKLHLQFSLNGKTHEFPVERPDPEESTSDSGRVNKGFKSGSAAQKAAKVFSGIAQIWTSGRVDSTYYTEAISQIDQFLIPTLPKGFTDLKFRYERFNMAEDNWTYEDKIETSSGWVDWEWFKNWLADARANGMGSIQLGEKKAQTTATRLDEPVAFDWSNLTPTGETSEKATEKKAPK